MFESLVQIDVCAFNFINQSLANPVSDFLMPIITDRWFLRGVLLLIAVAMLIWGKREGRIGVPFLIIAVAISDQASSQLFKPMFERIRPCHVIQTVHLLVDCSQGLSFPSSHAANVFAVAVFLSPLYRKARWYLFTFASLVCYSRIAVGVHYPYDVLFGALLGVAAGLLALLAYRWTMKRLFPSNTHTQSPVQGVSDPQK